jgi:alpha-amylase
MGVMMQAFHWDCPQVDGKEYAWWLFVREKVQSLANTGFTCLWLPPPYKAANSGGVSMGYDPYDYFDLGEFNQKGGEKTWFGSKQELLDLIAAIHANRMIVLADMVLNHNSGGDAQEVNEITQESRWTKFTPKSGKFPRDWTCFNPCLFETWDNQVYGDMPDLSHRNPYVYKELLEFARWLVEDIGFDGFRFDFVKGYGAWTVTALQEYRYKRGKGWFKPFGVGEDWDGERGIEDWMNDVNAWSDNPISAFDFPLHYVLKRLCDAYGFSLRELASCDSVAKHHPTRAVTFVDNHDLRDGENPIFHDKLLAYAYILTHEGFPCVFWKDYYNWDLGKEGTPNGIAALVRAHEDFAGGDSQVLYVDDNLYVMQRMGSDKQPGLVFVLNNRGDSWNGAWVSTRWRDTLLTPVAWWSGIDSAPPSKQWAFPDGRAQFWAPPRGYVVYAP